MSLKHDFADFPRDWRNPAPFPAPPADFNFAFDIIDDRAAQADKTALISFDADGGLLGAGVEATARYRFNELWGVEAAVSVVPCSDCLSAEIVDMTVSFVDDDNVSTGTFMVSFFGFSSFASGPVFLVCGVDIVVVDDDDEADDDGDDDDDGDKENGNGLWRESSDKEIGQINQYETF